MNKNIILIITLSVLFCLGLGFFVIYYVSVPSTPYDNSQKGDGLITSNVDIDTVDVLQSSLQPALYILVIKGMISDNCSQIKETVVSNKPNQIDVSLNATKPHDAVCEMEERPFEIDKELDFSNLESGQYLIKVAEFEKTIEYNKASFDN